MAESKLYPSHRGFTPKKVPAVGGVILSQQDIEYNAGRRTATITIRNTGDRPIQVGSHFHLFEVNRYLEFDRQAAFGMHLNLPATTAIRFEPGDSREVEIVEYGGKRRIIGFNNLADGYTGGEDAPKYLPTFERAMRRVHKAGFKCLCEAELQPSKPHSSKTKDKSKVKQKSDGNDIKTTV